MRGSTVISIAALFAAASAAPAIAQEAETRSQVVYFGDLNLDSPHGAHRLVHRIVRASAEVCSDDEGKRPLEESSDRNRCRARAEHNAVADVNAPLVTAEYYGHSTVTVTEGDEQYGPGDRGRGEYGPGDNDGPNPR
jgi:UrcA family protein